MDDRDDEGGLEQARRALEALEAANGAGEDHVAASRAIEGLMLLSAADCFTDQERAVLLAHARGDMPEKAFLAWALEHARRTVAALGGRRRRGAPATPRRPS